MLIILVAWITFSALPEIKLDIILPLLVKESIEKCQSLKYLTIGNTKFREKTNINSSRDRNRLR